MALFNNSEQRNDGRENLENSAKTLLANIRFMSVDNPIRTIAITSSIPNEGKTFIAMSLAEAIATSGRDVLIVETDMRRRSMANALGTHAQHGIYAVMSGEVSLKQAVVPTSVPHMYFLDAEPHIPNPSDLLNSRRFLKLVEVLRKAFAYVVFDTPPVGTFVDAAVLGTKVDALFMVVRENFVKKEEVVRAADQLQKAGVNLAGIIMNGCERQSSEYYYEYYYKDGRKSRHHHRRSSSSKYYADGKMEAPQQPDSWNNAPDLSELNDSGVIATTDETTTVDVNIQSTPDESYQYTSEERARLEERRARLRAVANTSLDSQDF